MCAYGILLDLHSFPTRRSSDLRSRPSSGTRGCELRNLQRLVPAGRPSGFSRDFARVSTQLANYRLFPLQRSEEHTSELQSHSDLVCRLLLEKKKKNSARISLHH